MNPEKIHSSAIDHGKDLDGRPIIGDVPYSDIGSLNGNAAHPETIEAIKNGELVVIGGHSEPGLEGYALFVQRIKKPAIIAGVTLGTAAVAAVVAVKVARRIRSKSKMEHLATFKGMAGEAILVGKKTIESRILRI